MVSVAALLTVPCVAPPVKTYGPVEQGPFLQRLGLKERAEMLGRRATRQQQEALSRNYEQLVAPYAMGARYKMLCALSGSGSDTTPVGFR